MITLEPARHSQTGEPAFRFVCRTCGVEGAWQATLNAADRAGRRHVTEKHPKEAASA